MTSSHNRTTAINTQSGSKQHASGVNRRFGGKAYHDRKFRRHLLNGAVTQPGQRRVTEAVSCWRGWPGVLVVPK